MRPLSMREAPPDREVRGVLPPALHLKKDSKVASFLILHVRCYTEIHLCFCKEYLLAHDCNIQLSLWSLSGEK